MNITPASIPVKSKNLTNQKPTNGPRIILTKEYMNVSLKEKTLSLDNAIPKDIRTRNIVE